MPLIIFSDQKHVKKIFDGSKPQTTRLRGEREIKKGDTLHCYFKSRMKKGTCKNCINYTCSDSNYCTTKPENFQSDCPDWMNKFGTALVTYAKPIYFYDLCPAALEAWAKADGFESFSEADEWFTKVHGADWVKKDWVLILFKGDWLK